MHTLTSLITSILAVLFISSETLHAQNIENICQAAIPDVSQNLAGFGYSSDLQQLTTQRCFNATISYVAEPKEVVEIIAAQSYSSLEQSLGVSVTAEGSYSMFSASAEANYMRSIQDNEYSLSLNYHQYISNKATVEIGNDVLTEFGKRLYNDGKNPLFGLTCGDKYVGTYQQGALLIMGLNIKMNSAKEKNEFTAKAGFKFGTIASAATTIKTVGEESKVSGSVQIHAYQVGGEPSQLAKIFKKDSEGKYYAFSCSIQAMDNCIQVASGLLDYATINMPEQVDTNTGKGLTPLGIAFTSFQPIGRLGLVTPPSLITPEIEQYRKDLAKRLKENQFYQQKLFPLLNKGYPVKLNSNFLRKVQELSEKVNKNVGILMQQHGGAADCYNYPENCKVIKAKIDSQLQSITSNDLQFLNVIKYVVPIAQSSIVAYNTGGDSKTWLLTNATSDYSITGIEVTSSRLEYDIGNGWTRQQFSGTSTGTPLEYKGSGFVSVRVSFVLPAIPIPYNATILVEKSPFYFETY